MARNGSSRKRSCCHGRASGVCDDEVTLNDDDDDQDDNPQTNERSDHCSPVPKKISRKSDDILHDESLSIQVSYPSGRRNITVRTPRRIKDIKRIARKSYRALSSSVVSSECTSDKVITEIAKTIKREMKDICSESNDSIIRDTNEGVKFFKWSRLFYELSQRMPNLIKLLLLLVPGNDNGQRVMLVCFIASLLLKKRFSKMALLQRAVSVLLYGNGCSKEVYGCLQPLMVCLSHYGTLKLIDRLAEDHDVKVQFWSQSLLDNLKKRQRMGDIYRQTNVGCESSEDVESTEIEYEEWNVDADEVEEEETRTGINTTTDLNELEEDGDVENILNEMVMTEGQVDEDCTGETEWTGFKIVGDNLDKNFRRSFQRVDYQTVSHHFFHMYAVRDRVNLSGKSDLPRNGVIDIPELLRSESDHMAMKKDFSVLISRVLVKHDPHFTKDNNSVVWHIPHKYSSEMKEKSLIIPLGVDFRNENKPHEMCLILDNLHQYVPKVPITTSVTLPNGELYERQNYDLWETLLGGDQLTAARVRGAIDIRDDHDSSVDKLRGLIPVVEDWHCRMTFLKVMWGRLFSTKSSHDKGTLFQIKNVIHRSSVPNDPKDNVQATEDFLEVVLVAHILTAAKHEYKDGMSVQQMCDQIINRYVYLNQNSSQGTQDQVCVYAYELMTLGLIWMNYYDAIKEGDGERVMRLWKYLLVIFRVTGHRNYAKEAALLLISFKYTCSERVAEQMMVSRFINTKGRVGCNLPCDLHLEHLNRRLKGIITKMESNIKPGSIMRAAKAIGVVEDICRQFNREMDKSEDSGNHRKPSYQNIICSVLEDNKIFENIPRRRHLHFSFNRCLLQDINEEEISDWLIEKIVSCFIL